MSRVNVWYDETCDQIFISGETHSFAPRSLVCTLNGGGSTILIQARGTEGAYIAGGSFADFGNHEGLSFETPEDAKAYLDGVFSRQPKSGDRVVVTVDIGERGQSLIPLQEPPRLLSSVSLTVNGLEYRAPDIAVSSVAVTWLNPDYPLDVADRVTLAYS